MLKTLGAGGLLLAGGVTAGVATSHRAVGELELLKTFEPASGQNPENIAIDKRGNKYVSMPGLAQIWKFSPDNELYEEPFAQFDTLGTFLTGVTGLEADPAGTIYACYASDLDPEPISPPVEPTSSTNGVWTVRDGREPELLAEISSGMEGGPTFPNDLVLFGDSLLVTDSFLGVVWQVRKNETAVWADDDLLSGDGDFGADGIQLSKDGKTVYVTNIAKGTIVEIPVEKDGSAETPTVFVDGLGGADGLAMDSRGYLYAADNRGNEIVRISPNGVVETLASNDGGTPVLDNPADVTFGTTGREQQSVFIVNLAFSDTPEPSFMKLDVGVPGLPVHR